MVFVCLFLYFFLKKISEDIKWQRKKYFKKQALKLLCYQKVLPERKTYYCLHFSIIKTNLSNRKKTFYQDKSYN